MTPPLWLKLWIDLLDDPKVADMPDWLFRRFILLLLAAKEYDKDGLLQPVSKLAWRLRLPEQQVIEALRALMQVGVVREEQPGAYLIVNFKKRQMVSDSADRVRRFRERQKMKECNAVTPPVSYSSSAFNIFSIYESEIGFVTKNISEVLKEAEKEYPAEWIGPAFEEASKHNARNWAYVEAVLKNWKANGFQSRNARGNGREPHPLTLEEENAEILRKAGLA